MNPNVSPETQSYIDGELAFADQLTTEADMHLNAARSFEQQGDNLNCNMSSLLASALLLRAHAHQNNALVEYAKAGATVPAVNSTTGGF